MIWKLYFLALPILFALDMVWLGLVAKGFYTNKIGYLMKPEISWTPAIIFYLLFALALIIFVINPSLDKNSWSHALIFGAFFGFVAYAAYDLTNHATIRDWPIVMTIVDMLWGATLSGSTSLVSFLIARKIGL